MKNCIRIPRLILPREIENWAVPACNAYAFHRDILERERAARTKPSLFLCVQHETYASDADEERKEEINAAMYAALEEEFLTKSEFGMMLVERTGKNGTRKGILTCIDLEAYGADSNALVRPVYSVFGSLEPWLFSRRGSVMEFPHSIVLYHDKKDKLMRALEKEDLENAYTTRLSPCGDTVRGLFMPADLSTEVAHELMQYADPCFIVLDGVRAVAAAKAYWEELKRKLTEEEKRLHPARFTLVEFVNIFDEALKPVPMHRVLRDGDAEAFKDYFSRRIPCEIKGNVITLKDWKSAEGVDNVLQNYIKQNGGRIEFLSDGEFTAEEDEVYMRFPSVEKSEILSVMKKGSFPYRALSLGDSDKRYSLEGREISYD